MNIHCDHEHFTDDNFLSSESQPIFGGRYTLTIETYKTGWDYKWGKVFDTEGRLVVSIQHDYSIFIHSEVTVNGNDYMLTTSCYAAGMLINLTTKKIKMATDTYHWWGGSISPDEKTLFVGGSSLWGPLAGFFYDMSDTMLVRLESPDTPYGNQEDEEDGSPAETDESIISNWISDTEMELTIYEPYYPKLNMNMSQAYQELIDTGELSERELMKLELVRRVVDVKRYRRDGDTVTEVTNF